MIYEKQLISSTLLFAIGTWKEEGTQTISIFSKLNLYPAGYLAKNIYHSSNDHTTQSKLACMGVLSQNVGHATHRYLNRNITISELYNMVSSQSTMLSRSTIFFFMLDAMPLRIILLVINKKEFVYIETCETYAKPHTDQSS